jgi:O-antigen/teichoic acid export membrane protein
LTNNQIAQLNSMSVLLGAAGFIVSCAVALPVSAFFAVPDLRWVIPVVSVACIVSALRAVPSALLERELRFRALAVTEGIHSVTAALCVLSLAVAGFGHWALVLGWLVSKIVWTGAVLFLCSHPFAWPRPRSIREPLAFSWHLLVSHLAWYAQANGHFLVVGRVFGQALLGAYTMSHTIASLPTAKISALVGRVVFPMFSAVQHDPAAMRRYLLSLTQGLSLLTFPLSFGLVLVADDFVLGILGDKWHAAITPLRVFGLLTLLQSIVILLPHVLNVTGDSRYAMRVSVAGGIVLPFAFYVGSGLGLWGVAAVWITVYPLLVSPYYKRSFARLDLSAAAYLKALWPALSASLLLIAFVWMLRQLLPSDWSHLLRLGLQIVVGAVGYVTVVMTMHRSHLQSFQRAILLLRDRTVTS